MNSKSKTKVTNTNSKSKKLNIKNILRRHAISVELDLHTSSIVGKHIVHLYKNASLIYQNTSI